MDKSSVERYSRQLLVPGMSVAAQQALMQATVSIVGLGGLGCPAALYLAAAGVGCLRLIDADTVDTSNLHRQVLHTEQTRGHSKVQSAAEALRKLNSRIRYELHQELVDASNALALLQGSSVIVDATDNAVTRYLLNDAACVLQVPLVSGAGLGWSGQLSVFDPARGTPCYRCLYPEPPPALAVCNCDEGGVVGPVVGVIGSLQALQVIRLLSGLPAACTDTLLAFHSDTPERLFRQPRIRARSPSCVACGQDRSSIVELGASGQPLRLLPDYRQWCGGLGPSDKRPNVQILSGDERMAPADLAALDREHVLLVDVRPHNHFHLCSLPDFRNYPYAALSQPDSGSLRELLDLARGFDQVVCICRRGNDSQRAVALLRAHLPSGKKASDVAGGLSAYAATVDANFPIY